MSIGVGAPVPAPTGGAAAVILDEAGRVLVVKENYDRRRWTLPGGAIEGGETPEEAVVRETLEETGVAVAIDHLVGVYTLENGFTVYAYRCTIVAGEPRLLQTGEIAWVGWHDAAELPEPRSNVLHYAVPDALLGVRDARRRNLPLVS